MKVIISERCVCGNLRDTGGNVPTYEQHGFAARLPVALVHCVSHPRLLVLRCCLVVSAMSVLPIDFLPIHTLSLSNIAPCTRHIIGPGGKMQIQHPASIRVPLYRQSSIIAIDIKVIRYRHTEQETQHEKEEDGSKVTRKGSKERV